MSFRKIETRQISDLFIFNLPGWNPIYNNGEYNENYEVVLYDNSDYEYEYTVKRRLLFGESVWAEILNIFFR